MNNTKKNNKERIEIASRAMNGLLSSQDPERGWNINSLAIMSLRIADTILFFSDKPLPEMKPIAENKEESPKEEASPQN
jgi:hypothetical protein